MDLQGDGINVNVITTDPDSSSYRAAADLHQQGSLTTPPQHQLDTHHISRGQRRNIKKTYFSTQILPGRTAAERRQVQNWLADDIPARCTAEHQAALADYTGDVRKVKRAMTLCAGCHACAGYHGPLPPR